MTWTGVRRLLRVAARARRGEAVTARVGRVLVVLLVALGLAPLARPVLLSSLDQAAAAGAEGLAGAWLRAALVVLTYASLAVHGRLLHGEARRVLALHPVDPAEVVAADLVLALRSGVGFAGLAAIVLGAVAVERGPEAWLGGAVVLLGAAALGVVLAAIVLLGAVRVAEDPRAAPLLDAVRGNNPPAQAAIIWALAPSTLVGGYGLALASGGAAGTAPVALVALPALAAVVLVPLVPGLARTTWWRAGFVVADIRARYAAVEQPEDVGRVWLDGWVTRLPPPVRREALLLLRYGWRERRGWLSGLWIAGLGAVALGWSEDPGAAARTALAVGAGAWWVGALPVQAAVREAPFLRTWLGRATAHRAAGAGVAALAWGSAPAWAGAAAVGLRQGVGAALVAAGAGLGLVVVAGLASAVASGGARGALRGYVVAGAIVLGAVAWSVA